MKYDEYWNAKDKIASPSLRRVWVEMYSQSRGHEESMCHPPCGGCGLKFVSRDGKIFEEQSPSLRRVWVEMRRARLDAVRGCGSPSLRRVWVEMCSVSIRATRDQVTLLAEGVG